MNGHEAHARARELFARIIARARDIAPDELDFRRGEFDAAECDFHAAMADLNRELQKSHAMAAALREYAARYDTLHALIMQSSDTDSYTMREAVVAHNAAAAIVAGIGRDIERARHGGP